MPIKRNPVAEALIPELAEFAEDLAEFEREHGLTFYEQDVLCPRCGAKSIRSTRDPAAPGYVVAVCNSCLEA